MSEKLFQLQLTLKKNSVNSQRKNEEVDRLCSTYTDQIKKYMISIQKTISEIFPLFNRNLNDDSINIKFLSDNIELSTVDDENLSIYVSNILETISDFLKNIQLNEDDLLPYDLVEFLFSNFHFLWSQEYCNLFSDLIIQTSKTELGIKIFQLLIFQPNVQMYIINSLQLIFDILNEKSIDELFDLFKQNLIKYSPVFPVFARKALDSFTEKGTAFWSLVEIVFSNFDIFGLKHSEFILFSKEKLNQLKEIFNSFFLDESKSKYFIEEIINCKDNLCAIPSEEKVSNVVLNYKTFTLLTPSFFTFLSKNQLNDSFKNYQTKQKSFFLNVQNNKNNIISSIDEKEQIKDSLITKEQENKFYEYISNFLLRASLIRIPNEHGTAIEYFQALSELSSVYGDPDLEDDLDKLTQLIPKNSTIQEIENKLEKIIDENSKSEKENPLIQLATYSAQHAYLVKLTTFFNNLESKTKETQEFYEIKTFFDQEKPQQTSINEENISNSIISSDNFLKEYELYIQKTSSFSTNQLRSIFMNLFCKHKILATFKTNKEIQDKDVQFQNHIQKVGPTMIDMQKHEWLEPFKKDKTKLQSFNQFIHNAISSPSLIETSIYIHNAYQELLGLLMIADIGEVGADQLVPFALLAVGYCNELGLLSLKTLLNDFLSPLFGGKSPVDHAVEYSTIQFISTIKAFEEFSE